MCFSASASFAASGGLAVIGAASLRTAPKDQRALALIPLLFALQQALEGVQWLALGQSSVCTPAGYGFLFFALLLWPVYIPLTVYALDRARRRTMRWFVLAGACVTAYYGFLLATVPLVIRTIGHHIFYDPPASYGFGIAQSLYVIATAGALLFSTKKAFRVIGISAIAAAALAMAVSWAASASVWCFFAACMSAGIYAVLRYKWLA